MRDLPQGNQVPSTNVTAAEVASRLLDAADPMAFITDNLKAKAVVVEAPTPAPTPPQTPPHAQPQPAPAPQQQQPENPEKDKQPEGNALLEEIKRDKETSNREARKKINELNTTLTEKDSLLTQLQEQVQQYERGEVLPEPVKSKLERMTELERYEEIHNLRMSPKYQEKYVKPIETLKQKAIQLATDYEVDPGVLDDAMQIGNRRERNAFLKQHFDEIGALEVRTALEEITRITDEAHAAEATSGESFQRLQREHEIEMQARETQRYEGLNRNATQGWGEALMEIKREGTYPELVLTGDPKQDAIVKPILQKAAESFGDFIKLFGVKKMEDLPPEAAKTLSKTFLLAHATSVAMASRNDHFRRAEDVINTAHRDAPFLRPQVGSSNVSPNVPSERPAQRGRSLEDAAGDLLNSVLHRK